MVKTADDRLRAAERSGDRALLIRERFRAGRCPGCGDPTRHADRKIDTIRFAAYGLAVHDEQTLRATHSLSGAVNGDATGEWESFMLPNGGARLTDPCGRSVLVCGQFPFSLDETLHVSCYAYQLAHQKDQEASHVDG